MSVKIETKKQINISFIEYHDKKMEKDFEIKINCNVFFIESKNTLERILGERVPDWVIGTYKGDNILLLKRESWKNPSVTNYEKLILHELAHIYTNHITEQCPIWMMEGLAMFYASQIEDILTNSQKKVLNPYYLSYEDDIYYHAASVIKELTTIYGVRILVKKMHYNMEKYYHDPIVGIDAVETIVNKLNMAN